jgi:hypothetical protein
MATKVDFGIIKKYVSPDVFPSTIRDNFRKLMGYHYVVDPTDNTVKWNDDAVKIPLGSDTVQTNVVPENPDQSVKTLTFSRVSTPTSAADSVSRDASKGLATLRIKVQAPTVVGAELNYGSVETFREDIEHIFKNPDDLGFYFDRTFEYSVPVLLSPEGDVGMLAGTSFSSYNYLVEPYEAAIQNASETILPNHYNISLVERSLDTITGISDVSGDPDITMLTKGSEFLPFSDTTEHTSLMGSIDMSVIKDQGLYSDSFIESEYLESGLTLQDYMSADLQKTLELKYTNYFNTWPDSYTGLTSGDQSYLEQKGKNIIFSGVVGASQLVTGPTLDYGGKSGAGTSRDVALPTYNKLPFYAVLTFLPEQYTATTGLEPGEIKPIATEMATNLLYSTFGSYLAGVYDPSYIEPVGSQPEYSFNSKTFIDSDNSQEVSFLASEELHDYVNYATATPNTDANGSFISALTWHGVALFGDAGPSPVSSFATDNKLFIDADYASAGRVEAWETDLALTLSLEDGVPNLEQAAATLEFISQTTLMSTDYPLWELDAYSDYGPGAQYGLSNQVNESFRQEVYREWGDFTNSRLYGGSFEDGLPSHNETVMYRVAKYVGSDTTAAPVQNIWIPSVGGTLGKAGPMSYVDSQVKFGQEYTYVTSAFKYVFGLKYKYERVVEPQATIVETVIDSSGTTIGYIVGWTGFINLFDDWELATEQIANSSDPPWATYANLYDPAYNYTADDQPIDAPGFFRKNAYYLSIDRINEILEKAWSLVPQTRYSYGSGQPENLSLAQVFNLGGGSGAGFADSSGGSDEVFGLPWLDEYNITPDTPVQSIPSTIGSVIFYSFDSLGSYDPATFSVADWLSLFFGAGFGTAIYLPGHDGEFRSQWLPPSHHLLHPITSEESGIGGSSALGATGFENLILAEERYTYGSVTTALPGASSTIDASGYEAEYEIRMHPVAEIVEVPYFTTRTSVQSKPPPPPDVTIIPYRGVNDTLLFNMSANNIEVEQHPVPIEEGEAERFEMLREAQGVMPGGKIKFIADDTTAFFQIYRAEKAPFNYSDFSGKLRNTISTTFPNKEQVVRSTAVSHEEKLQPNIKYYYTFRSVDYHGNFSNPTSVYEVELVDDGGAVYLLVKPYDFPVNANSVSTIDMKKFIQIVPSITQVTADVPTNTSYDDPSDIPTVELGSDSIEPLQRVWDKTFKVRLTSKKTGKKIDLNLTFNKEDKRIKTT